jgi:hypothetical protein
VAAVGICETLAAIAAADRFVLATVVGIVALWAVTWSRTLSIVLAILDVEYGPLDGILLFGIGTVTALQPTWRVRRT